MRRAALLLLGILFAAGPANADVVLSGGGLTLVEEGGSIVPGNLALSGTAFAKDLLLGYPAAHTIPGLNDQLSGHSKSWIGNSAGTFAGVSFGGAPVPVSSIAFGRDNTGTFTDRTLGNYTLQYTTVPSPDRNTTSWTTIGSLNYGPAGGTNFAFPSKRHRYTFNAVAATGIRLIVPSGGLATGTCIDELEAYSGIVVTSGADENDESASDGTGISLREAVRDAASGDVIVFAPALSGETITLTLGSEIVFGKNLTIDARSLPAGITIDGGPGTNRIFYIPTERTITLNRLTLTGGNGFGAIYSGSGGAIENQGTLALTQCTLSGNSATSFGGAIDNFVGVLMLTQCTLSGNSAELGGATYNYQGALTLTQCTVSGNFATDSGGAISNISGTLTLTNSIVAGNTAPNGENFFGDITQTVASITTGDPLLSPLGNYGGPSQTMPPLAGSPAIDTAVGSLFTNDQRGFPLAGLPDIGAAEGVTVVTTSWDELDTPATSGTGISLREAVRDTPPAGAIGFGPALSGATCTLNGEMILGSSVTIDASSLPAGVTLSGGETNRIFSLNPGQTVTLKRLTLTKGNQSGSTNFGYGGAVENRGVLALTQCTLFGNSAAYGGAIDNEWGVLTLTQCTLSGNTATSGGGAIENGGTLTLTQCTLSGNSTVHGGAIANYGTLTLTNSIVAGNRATAGPEIYNVGTINRSGVNLLGENGTVTTQFPSGSPNAIGDHVGTNSTPLAQSVAPLDRYGGPTQTRPPLVGSPAVDAAVGSLFTTDQRGFPIAGLPDIGAVENGTLVTTGADELDTPATSGNGVSLREAARDTPPGGTIGFAPTLSGGTCTLVTEIVLGSNITIDASNLSAGVTIDGGPGSNRIFHQSSGSISMLGLTLTGGNGEGAINNACGGAVYLQGGSLNMNRCSLVGNSASLIGGAIYNGGTLTLTQSTLSGNSSSGGGAIYNNGTMKIAQSTLAGNSSGSFGGAIFNSGTLTLTQSTLSGNSTQGFGGAIYNGDGKTLTLTNSIVAGNTAPIAGTEDIFGSITQTVASITNGDPLLSPLGNYGGPTQTMALLPGSTARNAATVLAHAITSDQRGFPIVGTPDIGAYEAGTIKSFDTWGWETKGSLLDFNTDEENDGGSNGLEYATRRDPMLSDPSLAPEFTFNGGGHGFRFRYQKDATDLRYIVQRSTDLGANSAWQEIYRLDTRTGVITENGVTGAENPSTGLIDITDPTASSRSFWRLLIEQAP